MNDTSSKPSGTPSRRALIIGGGAVVAAAAGAYAVSRQMGGVDNSPFKPVSYSFEDSDICRLTAAVEEGPFYIEEALIRRDIRDGRAGTETLLRLKIVDDTTCVPISGAAVDIWHCDAEGKYSAAPAMNDAERTASGHLKPVGDARFLRGRQVADGSGFVEFVTIYPGWYSGRTPHIHVKVYVGERETATTQLFFPKALSKAIFATGAYAKRGQPDTTNDNDGVLHRAQGADGTWPKMTRVGDGLTGTLTIGIVRVA